MPTPVWKKRLILIVGLLEVLVFSGTLFGWTGLVYMLKSEGVYQYMCDDIKHDPGFNGTEDITKKPKLKRNTDTRSTDFVAKLKYLNKEVIDLLLAERPVNGSNVTVLDQLEAYHMEPSFEPQYVSALNCSFA